MMQIINTENTPYYTFQLFEPFRNILHFVTSRKGGVSEGSYKSLNIGLGTDDLNENVIRNRELMAASVTIPLQNFVFLNQIHETNVAVIQPEMKGAGSIDKSTAIYHTDAAITNHSNICLFVQGADCVPILFYDFTKKVIGACHSGWRGTVKKIASKTIAKMVETFQCNPLDIHVAIGPSIGPCCYEVGSEVMDSVLRTYGTIDNFISFDAVDATPKFNLWHAVESDLIQAGIPKHQIENANTCTLCHCNDFFSSRHGKGITGRFGAGIMLKS